MATIFAAPAAPGAPRTRSFAAPGPPEGRGGEGSGGSRCLRRHRRPPGLGCRASERGSEPRWERLQPPRSEQPRPGGGRRAPAGTESRSRGRASERAGGGASGGSPSERTARPAASNSSGSGCQRQQRPGPAPRKCEPRPAAAGREGGREGGASARPRAGESEPGLRPQLRVRARAPEAARPRRRRRRKPPRAVSGAWGDVETPGSASSRDLSPSPPAPARRLRVSLSGARWRRPRRC